MKNQIDKHLRFKPKGFKIYPISLLIFIFINLCTNYCVHAVPSILNQITVRGDENSKSECSFVDLRMLNKLIIANRNQGRIAWCYAHTAADLLQFHFDTGPISASDIAIKYSKLVPAKIMSFIKKVLIPVTHSQDMYLEPQTGFIKIALENAMKVGVCPRHLLPDEKILKINLNDGSRTFVDYQDGMYDLLKNFKTKLKKMSIQQIGHLYEFPNLDSIEFLRIVSNYNQQKIFDVIDENLCDENRVSIPKASVRQVYRGKNLFKSINEQLDKKNIVAIDYLSGIFNNPTAFSLNIFNFHTSSIIGKKWNNKINQCEYLIRNSYGNDCSRYHKLYSCEHGNVWVTKNILKKAVWIATYLE